MHTELPDIRPLHRIAVMTFTNIVDSVRQADLHAATPCADWQLVDLLAHMTVQHRGFAAAARGFGKRSEVWHVESVRDAVTADPGTAYADAARDVLAAFDDNAVLEASFALPDFGPNAAFPGAVAIGFHFVDYVVHGWDVATTLGVPFTLPDEVVDAALPLALLAPDGEARDAADAPFAHVTAGPCVSTLDKILRYLGREPGWTPTSGQR
jgi:uncharacterized protein (TIGR03086 family)